MTNPMNEVGNEYRTLLNDFLSGKLPASEFQREYLNRFKSEKRWLDSELFDLLEKVFGDVDSYSSDPELLAANPAFYLDEVRLRERIRTALDRLLVMDKAH